MSYHNDKNVFAKKKNNNNNTIITKSQKVTIIIVNIDVITSVGDDAIA